MSSSGGNARSASGRIPAVPPPDAQSLKPGCAARITWTEPPQDVTKTPLSVGREADVRALEAKADKDGPTVCRSGRRPIA